MCESLPTESSDSDREQTAGMKEIGGDRQSEDGGELCESLPKDSSDSGRARCKGQMTGMKRRSCGRGGWLIRLLAITSITGTSHHPAVVAAASSPPPSHSPPNSVDWDSFGFGLNGVQTEHMWLDTVKVDLDDPETSPYSASADECLRPFGAVELYPTSTVLNYGQSLFEGLKAFRREDGTIVMFRPDRNALRMADGARRFLLPAVDPGTFVAAADEVVRANSHWVPPRGKGALYLRPLLMGTGADLGVKASHTATFCIYACPVGNYFKGALKAIRLQAVRGFSRATVGGAGSVKAAGNYAPAFHVQRSVRQRGFDEVLCLDAATGTSKCLRL